MSDLHYLPAAEALRMFRSRELSPVELLASVIDRAEEVEPAVNALCHRFFEQATEQAREAEARYMGRGPSPRPLEGIPTAVKEEEEVAGQPWTQGSLIYKDAVAETSSCFAQRIVDSGAIIHARTTAPEFSCAGFTHSRLWGVTRNPWNPGYGVGGSSGGSGAALASGTAALASGSDIGGSIRIPAAYNGVVGFKPPYGRVPQVAPFNLDVYCHCGPLARTVADCALFENVLAGPHAHDHVSLRPKLEIPAALEPAAGLRVAVSTDLGDHPVDPDVAAATLAAAAALREAGVQVDEVDLHLPSAKVHRAAELHFALGFAAWINETAARHRDLMTAYALDFARWTGEHAHPGAMLEELEIEAELYPPLGELLLRYDALICPTCGSRGLVAGDDYVDHGLEVGGRMVEHYFESMLTPAFNILSRCPVLVVPGGLADNGIPVGIQIVGRTYDDVTPFRIGAALEQVRPWMDTAERRPRLGRDAATT
jgi:Asp-tRNA(Asn)/Glu-tRNA(Gln) amidotransferase A subunit family amidase